MSLDARWAGIVAQVRSNRRLAWMLSAIAAVLLLLLVDACWTQLQDQRAELDALRERRDRLQSLSGSTEWFARAEAGRESLAALQAGIPAAESPGLAQALFQGWLRERTAGMDGSVFAEVGTPQAVDGVQGMDGLVRVTATVSGRSHRNTVIDLIRRAEAAPDLITVDAFSVPASADNGFSVTLSAYFRVPPANGGAR
ncbi:MAG TPA: hypothetical protein VFV33_03925 [Gemmatimonadaceae bacterium]|nr:hypothetical protein [Gemmatimonadaceae bacterium]